MPTEAIPRGERQAGVCSYVNQVTGDFYTRDVADKAAVAHVGPVVTDTNNVTGRTDTQAGTIAQSSVTVAGAINEGGVTDGSVGAAGDVEVKGLCPDSCVLYAGGVAKDRENTNGRIVNAGGVIKERVSAGSGVLYAGDIANYGIQTDSGV